ncbi:hypothetical protein KJ815_03430, partial [bacterium]|nr:hypothetical protein [bacterium]
MAPTADPEQPSETVQPAAKPVIQETSPVPGEGLEADTSALIIDYVAIETPLYRMSLSSNGMVSSYQLKEYILKTGEKVQLHLDGQKVVGSPDIDFGSTNPKTIKNLRFDANKSLLSLNSGSVDSVILTAGDMRSQQVVLTYIFRAEQYGFQIAVRTEGLRVPETGEFRVKWVGGVPNTEPDPEADLRYSGAYAQVGSELEKFQV